MEVMYIEPLLCSSVSCDLCFRTSFCNVSTEMILFCFNCPRLNNEFITTVQQRGAAIIKARKLSSALSAASSACDHIRDWVLGTPKVGYFQHFILWKFLLYLLILHLLLPQGTWVSMGVYSDGSYGIQPGLIYSFPVTCENGEWKIVQGAFCFLELCKFYIDF